MLLKEEQKIFVLLNEYLSGEVSREKFSRVYTKLITKLKPKLEKGLYHPLDVIVPTEDNNERAWKENMRNMYLREIERLDRLLEENEPSYAEKLTEHQQKELCKEAIDVIPKAALGRSSKVWIESNLIEDEEFTFVDENGKSKLGSSEVLYQATLVRKSFIMTAFSGGLTKLEYDYALLVKTLKIHADGDTVWVRCSESDGFTSIDSAPRYIDPDDEVENINWLEYTDPQTNQWGPCYLLFMPGNRKWLLVHSNNFEGFSIVLHGPKEFMGEVLSEVNNA